jgi:hypothetical protein
MWFSPEQDSNVSQNIAQDLPTNSDKADKHLPENV